MDELKREGCTLLDRNARGLLAIFVADYSVAMLKWALFQQDGSSLSWLVDILTHLVLPLILTFILARKFSIVPRLYGLSRFADDSRRLKLWVAFPLYTVVLAGALLTGYIVGLVTESVVSGGPSSTSEYSLMLPQEGTARTIAVVYFAISAGIFEEIFFRGIFQLLCDVLFPNAYRMGVVVASALLFSSTHWAGGIVALTTSLAFGLVAAWLFSYQRDLRPLVLSHTVLDVLIGFQ